MGNVEITVIAEWFNEVTEWINEHAAVNRRDPADARRREAGKSGAICRH